MRATATAGPRIQGCRGYAAMPVVTMLAMIMTFSLLMLFREGGMHRDQAAKAQLRADYHQREEALLRALVAAFPERAIACMRANYAASADYSWSAIFTESEAMASAAESLPADLLTTLGLDGARSGDVGDAGPAAVVSWITSLEGVQGKITPGTTAYSAVFDSAEFAGKVPPLLSMPSMSQVPQDADEIRPVVALEKHYATQHPDLQADVSEYPTYNLIPYPDVRFGFAAAGQPFVAKRNWWAFTVAYGTAVAGEAQPVPVVSKHYVLSLYEIPTQLPIEGAAFAEIGTHQDGSAWSAADVSIDGGVYGSGVSLSGGYGANRITAKQSIQMASPMTVDGSVVGNDFDAPGVREQLQVDRRTDVLPVGLSANSGRLAFLPIHRAGNFLQHSAATDPWEVYSRGAEKCGVMVEAIAMISLDDQTPLAIRVRFQSPAGEQVKVELRRGVNWPTLFDTGGDEVPFQTELTASNRSCLSFYPAVMDSWIQTKGGASVTTNNSFYIGTDESADPLTVRPISDPPSELDMGIIIRSGKDLTSYAAGLSIVTPHRIYVGDDLNDTPALAPPAGSGLPAGTVFYPPLSIFSAELRIGTTGFIRPFEHHGQLTTLSSGGSGTWHPLDVKSGSDDAVHADSIAADLTPLRSPAELPPVHQMNWLVTIEEIPQE